MKTKSVVIEEPFKAALKETDIDEKAMGADQIFLKTRYSLVSAGTELAIYRGTEDWAPLPFCPGYAAVGQVLKAGKSVKDIKKGEMIFCYCGHSQFSMASAGHVVVKFPQEYNARHIVFTRIAAVSITALRVSDVQLGDWAAVFGLGLVGNLAVQLFCLAGAKVIGIDVSEKRLELAKQCNVEYTINPQKEDVKEKVMELTDNKGVNSVVEATGVPSVVERTFEIAAPRGEVILLGSPRGQCQGDITGLLNCVHQWGKGCVTLKGAHEWQYPIKPSQGCKHSIQRNCEILVELIANKKLIIDPLITHIESPANVQQVYQGLLNKPNEYVGVVFDWEKV